MAVTRKAGFPPLVMPSETNATTAAPAATTTVKAKASGTPGPYHVRVRRGEADGGGIGRVVLGRAPVQP